MNLCCWRVTDDELRLPLKSAFPQTKKKNQETRVHELFRSFRIAQSEQIEPLRSPILNEMFPEEPLQMTFVFTAPQLESYGFSKEVCDKYFALTLPDFQGSREEKISFMVQMQFDWLRSQYIRRPLKPIPIKPRLFHRIFQTGSGIPLVFLHGFLGTSADWETVTRYFSDRTCIALDLPGHGYSPFLEEFTIPFPRFHLIGYSMGGRLALQYQKKHPEQVASLHLLSVHPGLEKEEERTARWERDRDWAHLLLALPIDEFLKRWYDQPIFQSYKPDLTWRRRQDPEALAASLLYYSLAKQPKFAIDGVMVGEKDLRFRALYQEPIIISGAGHMIHLEKPRAVALELMKRIKG